MSNELRDRLPRHRSDCERAEALLARGFPALEPVLDELLEWTQDGGWPVSRPIYRFLVGLGEVASPRLRRILRSDDNEWKWWIIESVVNRSPEIARALLDDLVRISEKPTDGERRCELDTMARETLLTFGFH